MKPIGWRPWLWCIAFGVWTLIWVQVSWLLSGAKTQPRHTWRLLNPLFKVLITIPDRWVKKVIKVFCCGCTSIKRRLEARKSKKQLKKKSEHELAEEEEAEAKKIANTRWVRGSIRINSQVRERELVTRSLPSTNLTLYPMILSLVESCRRIQDRRNRPGNRRIIVSTEPILSRNLRILEIFPLKI